MNPKGLQVHKSDWDWAEIIKTFVDVLSGQAHNRTLQETLKLILELQILSKHSPSEELIRSFGEFYRGQFVFYLKVLEPKPQNIFTLFEPEEELDPRLLAWEDTGKLMHVYFHLSGTDPMANQRRNQLVDQIIANITTIIQANGTAVQDRDKLSRVIEFLSKQVNQE